MTETIIILGALVAVLCVIIYTRTQRIWDLKGEVSQNEKDLESFKSQYKDIIDVDSTLLRKNIELKEIKQSIANLKDDFEKQKEKLNQDYIAKKDIYENLLKEISIVEENLEDISYGLYKPHYEYSSSEEYKQKLEEIWNKERDLIKSEKAVYCPTEWTVSGSKVEGKKMVQHQSKLMLRAFNGECDSAIAKVKRRRKYSKKLKEQNMRQSRKRQGIRRLWKKLKWRF